METTSASFCDSWRRRLLSWALGEVQPFRGGVVLVLVLVRALTTAQIDSTSSIALAVSL